LKETIKKLIKAAQIIGLTINMRKTKYLEVTKNQVILKEYDQEYERVKGIQISRNNLSRR
jgi:hypothetical protein